MSPNSPDYAPTITSKRWTVGTLSYDTRRLGNVFFWMLWGDFCLMLMDAGPGNYLPTLLLDAQGASSATIGLVKGTVIQAMTLLLVAPISTWSDRHRGPLGRRMPFMLYSTPFIAVFLICLGFSPKIAGWMHVHAPHLFGGIAISSLTIGVISTTYTLYKLFDLFPQAIYYYLLTDVIPHKLMGKFTSWLRVCSTAGSAVFNYFLLGQCAKHPGAICVGVGILYLVTFLLLCLIVKEGKYPPPEPRAHRRLSLARIQENISIYSRECYSLGFYWKIYLYNLCFVMAILPMGNFLILYAKHDMQMTEGFFGHVMFYRDLMQIPVFLAMGPIVDRFHPLRAGVVGYILLALSGLSAFLFIGGTKSFIACVMFLYFAVAVYQGCLLALGPRILPRDKYGQFCSANSMVISLGSMAGMWACGKFLDVMQSRRYVFLWFFCFTTLGAILIWTVFLQWKRLGGDEHYEPPLKGRTAEPRI
jgi:maltose/moltooligosaccharide transporter